MLKRMLWLLPFLCFFLGYLCMSRVIPLHERSIPTVLGLTLQDGLATLAAAHLYGYMIGEKEVADIPPGIIMEQIPTAGTLVKERQAVSIVVSKRSPGMKAPLLMGKQQEEIGKILAQTGIRSKEHWVEHHQPRGCCVAQYPISGAEVSHEVLHLYYSKGITPVRIVPTVCGLSAGMGTRLLTSAGINPCIIPLEEGFIDQESALIQSQKPLAGTLIVLQPGMTMHLFVADQQGRD